jgi:hypothetical protein
MTYLPSRRRNTERRSNLSRKKAEPAGEPLILTAISQNRKASRPSGGPVLE